MGKILLAHQGLTGIRPIVYHAIDVNGMIQRVITATGTTRRAPDTAVGNSLPVDRYPENIDLAIGAARDRPGRFALALMLLIVMWLMLRSAFCVHILLPSGLV